MKPIRLGPFTFTWSEKCSCYQFYTVAGQNCPGVECRLKPGYVCRYCYAKLGRFSVPRAKSIGEKNAAGLAMLDLGAAGPLIELMGFVQAKKQHFFRWFSAGDGRPKEEIIIIALARLFPGMYFWWQTQNPEIEPMKAPNLAIRRTESLLGVAGGEATSMVLNPGQECPPGYYQCPGKCEGCRKCWTAPNGFRVAFPFHGSAVAWARLKKDQKSY